MSTGSSGQSPYNVMSVTYDKGRQRINADQLRALHAVLSYYLHPEFISEYKDWVQRGCPDYHMWTFIEKIIDFYNAHGPSRPIDKPMTPQQKAKVKGAPGWFYDQEPTRTEE